jgi:hypothetical protein
VPTLLRGGVVKRGGPLKRGNGPSRLTPLRQGDKPLKRTTALRVNPARVKRRQGLPPAIRREVFARSHGSCVACLYDAGFPPEVWALVADSHRRRIVRRYGIRPCRDPHHVLSVQRFPQYEREPANVTGLCREHHEGHHVSGVKDTRIPRQALPEVCLRFALDAGREAAAYLVRHYPIAGSTPQEA